MGGSLKDLIAAAAKISKIQGNKEQILETVQNLVEEESKDQSYSLFDLGVPKIDPKPPVPFPYPEPRRPAASTFLHATAPYTEWGVGTLTDSCQPAWLGLEKNPPPPYSVYANASPATGNLQAGLGLGYYGTLQHFPEKGGKPDTSVKLYTAKAGFVHVFQLPQGHENDCLALVDIRIDCKQPTSLLVPPRDGLGAYVWADTEVFCIGKLGTMRSSVRVFQSGDSALTSAGPETSFTPEKILTTANVLGKGVSVFAVGIQLELGAGCWGNSHDGFAGIDLSVGSQKAWVDPSSWFGQPNLRNNYIQVQSISCRLFPLV